MATNKRYYWLKLKEDFFTDMRMKRLRKLSGGGTYTIVYLKLLLLSLKDEGKLQFQNVDETFVKELSLVLDEAEDDIVLTLQFLERVGLLQVLSDDVYFLTELPALIGSETDKAQLMRKKRAKEKLNSNNVTSALPIRYTEIEKDIELDIDIKTDRKIEKEKDQLSTDQDQVKKCLKYYESVTGIMPLPLIQTEIQDYLGQKIQSDLICTAIQEAVNKNITQWSYIKAILERCLQDGIYTAEDFTSKKYKEEPVSKDRMQRKSPLPTFTVQE